jgi:hypothetical protein
MRATKTPKRIVLESIEKGLSNSDRASTRPLQWRNTFFEKSGGLIIMNPRFPSVAQRAAVRVE